MNLAPAWASLESSLDPAPLFHVDAPDKRKDWSELARQATLFRLMHLAAPRVVGFAVPNAGKRNPLQARREGIVSGVFDTCWHFQQPLTAYVELKGYDRRGRPGTLSSAQIEWGNRMLELGHHVACFFDPHAAVGWLRGLGFPVREMAA